MQEKETIIISLGGSILVPEQPDYSFIIRFKRLIEEYLKQNKRFFIIVGGGKVCRTYQDSLKNIIDASKEDLDWMGIYITRANAELLRLSFKEYCPKEIVTDPYVASDLSNDVVVCAGWKPGSSTDTDAVLIAEELGIQKIINISNIDYVYDSDPRVNKEAKKFENLSWSKYRSLISDKWIPGMSLPFDPIASKMSEENNIEVVFVSGKDLNNLENYLKGESFIGTVIK